MRDSVQSKGTCKEQKVQECSQKMRRRSIKKRSSALDEGKSIVENIIKHRHAAVLWEFLANSYPEVRRK